MQQTEEGRQNPDPPLLPALGRHPGGRRAGLSDLAGKYPHSCHIPGALTASGTAAGPLATVACSCVPFPQKGGRLVYRAWLAEKWFWHRAGCDSHPSSCLTPTLPTRASKIQLQGLFSLKPSLFSGLFHTEYLILRLGE